MISLSNLNKNSFNTVLANCHNAQDILASGGRAGKHIVIEDRGHVDFIAGTYTGWEGFYWSLELRTGIVTYHGSIVHLKEWVKLCRDCVQEANQND
jgi:hypothetical protein